MIGRLWLRLRAFCRGSRAQRAGGAIRVYYGLNNVTRPDAMAFGGTVKFQSLQDDFPNTVRGYNLVYLVSSGIPPAAAALVRAARKKGARFVWNQNGVGFPAWHGPGWERVNAPMRELLEMADHVFYQSRFCQVSADRYIGASHAPSEVLYNAVDTARFVPRAPSSRPLTLLVAGSHWQGYRVQVAIDALSRVRREIPDARLRIAGRFCWTSQDAAEREVRGWIHARGLDSAIDLSGAYSQRDAPGVMAQGDILIHAKCNDPCPTLVLEAMACGLPVVYSKSGGVPELVGSDAGRGVVSEVNWETHTPPAPADIAMAVLDIAPYLGRFRAMARERAMMFDLQPWRQRHRVVFNSLMGTVP